MLSHRNFRSEVRCNSSHARAGAAVFATGPRALVERPTCASIPLLLFCCAVALGCSSGGSEEQARDVVTSADSGTGGVDGGQIEVPQPDSTVGGVDALDASIDTSAEGGCTSASECGTGELCTCAGACVSDEGTPCTEDKNCGSGAFCELCTQRCAPQSELCEPCTGASACAPQGSACLDFASGGKFCGRACLSDVGCPPGFVCEEVPNVSDKQCVPSSGSCSTPGECAADADCPFPEICNAELLVCAPGCQSDDGCPVGELCVAGRCKPPCAADAECPPQQRCVEGRCKVPGGCTNPGECPEPATYCDLTEQICKPGCLTDFDCKLSSQSCVNGACVALACPGNFVCAFGEVCSQATGKCEAAQAPHCATCDPRSDSTCAAVDPQNACLSFQDEEGADLGSFCLVACGADPENPCPQGYVCQPVELGQGDTRDLCVRSCPVPPIGVP